jgi:hypothetical protein
VHVAASLFHDIAPANQLGLRSIWINRLGETANPRPARELGVDAQNPTGATRLYERAGMHQVFEAVVYEKPLAL